MCIQYYICVCIYTCMHVRVYACCSYGTAHDEVTLSQYHTFQHYSDMFKLNKHAECYKHLTNADGIKFKPFDMHQSL